MNMLVKYGYKYIQLSYCIRTLSSSHVWHQTLTGMEELSFLTEAIQLITSELSANLDTFADAILDASGVYRWSSTAQNELGELHWYV